MVGLIQGDVSGFVVDLVGDREVRVVLEHHWWGWRCGGRRCSFPFGDALILESNFFVD